MMESHCDGPRVFEPNIGRQQLLAERQTICPVSAVPIKQDGRQLMCLKTSISSIKTTTTTTKEWLKLCGGECKKRVNCPGQNINHNPATGKAATGKPHQ